MATSSKTCLVASVDSCHELSIHLNVIRGDGVSESRSVLFQGAMKVRGLSLSLIAPLQAFGGEKTHWYLSLRR